MPANFIQRIELPSNIEVKLSLFRLDLIHPEIQGNKYFKLLYNIDYAVKHQKPVLTFGGPHSNHIHATALACNHAKIPCHGIIRGTNFSYLSISLQKSQELGMQLHFIDRKIFKDFRNASSSLEFKELIQKQELDIPYNGHFIPEGGTNKLGIKGTKEILEDLSIEYDYVLCPVGTGGTIAGMINYLEGQKKVIGISSLKDTYLIESVRSYLEADYSNWEINFDYHFGGYAKWKPELIDFINEFKTKNKTALCPIYTGKMLYGIFDLIQKKKFPKGSSILAVHTGGQIGLEGFKQVNKGLLI